MAVFIYGPVAGETLAEVGVQPDFIATAAPSAEGHWADHGQGLLCHEAEIRPTAICSHRRFRPLIRCWLAYDVPEAKG